MLVSSRQTQSGAGLLEKRGRSVGTTPSATQTDVTLLLPNVLIKLTTFPVGMSEAYFHIFTQSLIILTEIYREPLAV
jgi:hypothetical protein